jgi:hypothetical protein
MRERTDFHLRESTPLPRHPEIVITPALVSCFLNVLGRNKAFRPQSFFIYSPIILETSVETWDGADRQEEYHAFGIG